MSRSEIQRLEFGPEPGQQPGGIGTNRFKVICAGDSDVVLAKARETLGAVLTLIVNDPEPTEEMWRQNLPPWFVAKFAKEPTSAESAEYLRWWDSLTWEQKQLEMKKSEEWTLSGWIYWFKSENREWFWWDADAPGPQTIWVTVEVKGWPYPWGALEWLFRAAGAKMVESE